MMLLIGLAITVAFLASWGASLGVLDQELDFWWELALLIVIMLLGHWIEMRSLAQTTSALDSLAALLPDEAERVVGNETELVAPTDLRLGDLVVVRPGGRVPADGRIRAGSASMDESMITGESKPVRRDEGDTVVAGTVATDSGVRIEISAVGDDTALAGIQRLVTEAQNSSSRAQRIADRAAALLFWFALIAGIITAVVWTVLGLPDQAVIRTITVLVIACPHALAGRVTDLELIVQQPWRIASRQRSSTTREYIGAVQDIAALREGRGEFDAPDEFYRFWRKYKFKVGDAVKQQLDRLIAKQS